MSKEPNNSAKGKRDNQKMKPFFVMEYLLQNSDENNRLTADQIRDALIIKYDISSNVRSIYDDIKEINKAFYLLNNADETGTMEAAAAALEEDLYDEEKLIAYSHSKPRGFYVKNRKLELDEVRLLAECIYTSKFITQKEADRLITVIKDLTTLKNAEQIKHDVVVSDRIKTTNKSVVNSLSIINMAMSLKIDSKQHTPEKISFQMLTHTMADKEKPLPRKTKYVVSPYKLIVNDGNYYLLAFEDKSQKMKTYRVDRLKSVSLTGESRDGEEAFKAIDMSRYLNATFSMFNGKPEYVKMIFINHLLDTVMERFGTKDVIYSKEDDRHFSISAKVYISDQFYGWLCGLGKRVKIISPDYVAEDYKAYLDKISKMYDSD